MEMSIEESIKELEILKKNTFSYMPAHQAFTTAVNIMRKYQKIEQILKDIPYGGDATIRRIQEVVEDGKDEKQS